MGGDAFWPLAMGRVARLAMGVRKLAMMTDHRDSNYNN